MTEPKKDALAAVPPDALAGSYGSGRTATQALARLAELGAARRLLGITRGPVA